MSDVSMEDVPNEIKHLILSQELSGAKQQIYRLSVSAEARKLAGYSDEENKGLLSEIERVVKLRDVLTGKMKELEATT